MHKATQSEGDDSSNRIRMQKKNGNTETENTTRKWQRPRVRGQGHTCVGTDDRMGTDCWNAQD